MDLNGVVVPMVTPFLRSGQVDFDLIPALTEFLVGAGVTGLVVGGPEGEGHTLDNLERRLILEQVRDTVAGRIPVFHWVVAASTREAVEQAAMARESSCRAVFIDAPTQMQPNGREFASFARAIIRDAGLPGVLLDLPDRGAVDQALELMAGERELIGLFEASGDVSRVIRLRERHRPWLKLGCATWDTALRYFAHGVDCWLAGGANALPSEHVAMLDYARLGDADVAAVLHRRLGPLMRTLQAGHYVPKLRLAVELSGIHVGPPRAPSQEVLESEDFEISSRLSFARGRSATIPGVATRSEGAFVQSRRERIVPFIDGSLTEPAGDKLVRLVSPVDGSTSRSFVGCDREDVDRAVAAARRVFSSGEWSRISADDRRPVVEKLAGFVAEHLEELATLDSTDTGKPISDCLEGDLPYTLACLRLLADSMASVSTGSAGVSDDRDTRAMPVPAGVVGLVLPWNFPTLMFVWLAVSAVAMGNSVVVKPAEESSSSALLLAQLLRDSGLPDGVLNILPGEGRHVGRAIGLHPGVGLLSFTGARRTGGRYLEFSYRSNLKKVDLRLAGRKVFIVGNSVQDLDEVAATIVQSGFWGAGQHSQGMALYAQRRIHDDLLQRLSTASASLRLGDPQDPATQVGPLVCQDSLTDVELAVAAAVRGGARVVGGGERVLQTMGGWFYAPTILAGIPGGSELFTSGVIGPILPVTVFDTVDELVGLMGRGASASSVDIWTSDIDEAHLISRQFRTRFIGINATADSGGPHQGYERIGISPGRRTTEILTRFSQTQVSMRQIRI